MCSPLSAPKSHARARRHLLAIFTADSGISFVRFNRRDNRRALATFDRKEITHLVALKIARFPRGNSKNRRCNRRESRDSDALSSPHALGLSAAIAANFAIPEFGGIRAEGSLLLNRQGASEKSRPKIKLKLRFTN